MRRLVLSAAAPLALALLAAPADAATVSSTTTSSYDPGGKGFPAMTVVTRQIAVEAAPGEANALWVGAGGGVVTSVERGGYSVRLR